MEDSTACVGSTAQLDSTSHWRPAAEGSMCNGTLGKAPFRPVDVATGRAPQSFDEAAAWPAIQGAGASSSLPVKGRALDLARTDTNERWMAFGLQGEAQARPTQRRKSRQRVPQMLLRLVSCQRGTEVPQQVWLPTPARNRTKQRPR